MSGRALLFALKFYRFLDASSHLNKRVCPSVRPLVHNAFVKIAENGVMQDGDATYIVYTDIRPCLCFS